MFAFIFIYSLINVCVGVAVISNWIIRASDEYPQRYFSSDFALPYRLHDATNMNWFGAWFCSLLLLVLFPLGYLLQFIWWLCHIGHCYEE